MTLFLRPYRSREADLLGQLYYRAVHEGATQAYDPAQRQAWAPEPPSGPEWEMRLGQSITWVATRGVQAVGFMALQRDGHLDLAFVLPEEMGTGTAQALASAIEESAAASGLRRLTTDASHLARSFFLKQGWRVLSEQQVALRGETLTNFQMEKWLSRP